MTTTILLNPILKDGARTAVLMVFGSFRLAAAATMATTATRISVSSVLPQVSLLITPVSVRKVIFLTRQLDSVSHAPRVLTNWQGAAYHVHR
jgi:hypothetical protein